jgi:16S rRNA (uracil1498-N3)-methyltransferase
MNVLLFDPIDLNPDGLLAVDGRQHRHLQEVIGVEIGGRIKIGALGGLLGEGVIEAITAEQTLIRPELSREPPSPLPLTVVLALPRPKMLKRVLQGLASLGVKEIHLINSYRVEKSFWQTPFLDTDIVREQLLLGLEQSGDTRLPRVHLHKLFKPFVEDRLTSIAGDSVALVAHPKGKNACPISLSGAATLAIGPEGGFIDYEIGKLEEAGFECVTLGPRILRVETAIPFLVSRLCGNHFG